MKNRLVTLTGEQDRLLIDLKDEISGYGGYVSFSQLLREAVNIMLQEHCNEIIQRHSPVLVEKRSKKVE